ncbi:MAG: L,D-transpeptidase family protein [Pseudomonadota bacterium]|nr:L,D-transpeptidase family protein [Pseudomonadota bacterium]
MMPPRPSSVLHARPGLLDRRKGMVAAGGLGFRCALGRGGVAPAALKREGDGKTPLGRYRLLEVLYRPDRLMRPRTKLPVRALRHQDGWCDDPRDGRYNRPVRLPIRASAERLWREDGLYDLIVILDHNDRPRIRGRGSAVFLHVARKDLAPTEGCVALPLPVLRRLLARLGPGARLAIG